MNTKIYSIACLSALALAACDYNDDHFEGLDDLVRADYTDIKKLSYTLTDEDYSKNGAKAGYFESDDAAAAAIINILSSKYPTADDKSAIEVTYNLATTASAKLEAARKAKAYTLADEDYAKIGANKVVTPATLDNVKSLLPSVVAQPASGDYVVVTMNWSDAVATTEPEEEEVLANWKSVAVNNLPNGKSWDYTQATVDLSAYAGQKVRLGFRYTSDETVAGTIELINLNINEGAARDNEVLLFAEGTDGSYALSSKIKEGKYLIAAKTADGNHLMFFGSLMGKDAEKGYGYCKSDSIDYTETLTAEAAAPYVLEIANGTLGKTIKNAAGKYLYMKGTYNNFNYADEVPAEGAEWLFTSLGSNKFAVSNTLTSKVLTYDKGFKNYGAYSGKYAASHLCSASTDAPEGYTFVDVNLAPEVSAVWSTTKQYGLKATANVSKVNYAAESWVVTPEIDLTEATTPLAIFNLCGNYFNDQETMAKYFSVCVSTDYTEGAKFVVNGNKSLKAAENATRSLIYSYNGKAWNEATDAVVVSSEDYTAMGSKYSNFSASMPASNYLPNFLAKKVEYPTEGMVKEVVYNFYDASSKETSISADEYVFEAGAWKTAPKFEVSTNRFAKTNGAWLLAPSVVIDLPHLKGDAFIQSFYQACTDWVWDNVDTKAGFTTKGQGYVTSYGNNEYYTGSSAYQNDVDWRAGSARQQYAAGYEGMTDEQVVEQMKKNLIEAWAGTLARLYPAAKAVPGVDVTYTVNFIAYYGVDGGNAADHSWTIVYKVVSDGVFEYVEGSLMEAAN
ncbi:MAG: hypothetical protein II951_06880 [Bacteroidales bacterium]|nr:hypothetical protein [Bacteroidales bacterium]